MASQDYLLRVHGLLPNGEAWSTGRRMTSGRDPATMLAAWGAAWDAAWTDGSHGMQAQYPATTTIEFYTCSVLDAAFHELTNTELTSHHAGTNLNAALPATVSIVVSWRNSGDIRRTARGHNALPAPSSDQVTGEKLNTGAVNSLSAAMNAIKAALTGDGSVFFTFNRDASIITGLPALTKTTLDVVKVRNKLGSAIERDEKEPGTYV